MGLSMLLLGALAAAVKSWPVVGQAHQQVRLAAATDGTPLTAWSVSQELHSMHLCSGNGVVACTPKQVCFSTLDAAGCCLVSYREALADTSCCLLSCAAAAAALVAACELQGLPLLLGSFGTFAILLFGRPEADAARLWPLLGGQLGATAIALCIIKLFGANLLSRAAAMAATVVYMMWSDTIHPPGGELPGWRWPVLDLQLRQLAGSPVDTSRCRQPCWPC
eukprot:GHRQ01024626.1.p1 GENE.GHRQ01024626.1~~GHRQ01024626.1.p1  ORF type:complete len:222 (+),score=71.59 GHRQ01024626.1:420-1085(+)